MSRTLRSHPEKIEPGSGQESVWDYPRPPRLERSTRHVEVVFNGRLVADSRRAWRILEMGHPPVYYIPRDDIGVEFLLEGPRSTFCEWKGRARYFDVEVDERIADRAAWSYPNPVERFAPIRDAVAFYAGKMDLCRLDGEIVVPQPGEFYGGWITADVVGPFERPSDRPPDGSTDSDRS
ncbi:MAG: DUF427 domain-containing protein [Thermoanaerobaculia bacterium]|nr:DUF427 domain-containing protein [Thermoanaerobaculia bacterium]